MEPWFDTTSEDDPFTGFEDPLSYTWLETSIDPLHWAAQFGEETLPNNLNATGDLGTGLTDPEPVESWLQRTVSNSQLSDRAPGSFLDESTSNSGEISRNTSASSLQSLASSANSFSRRGRRIKGGYLCSQCGESFDVPSELRHHKKKHMSMEERPHPCTLCDQRFIWPKDLKRHVVRKHPGSLHTLQASALDERRLSNDATPGPYGLNMSTQAPSFDCNTNDMNVPSACNDDGSHPDLYEPEEGLMLPRKKRKAEGELKDHCSVQGSPCLDTGNIEDHRVSSFTLPLEESSTSNALTAFAETKPDEVLMERKQRTKVWLKSAKVLFQEAKDLPGPLVDIYVHSLDAMAGNIDDLVVDETGSAIDREQARAALAIIVKYFKRPDQGLDLQEEDVLGQLLQRLKI